MTMNVSLASSCRNCQYNTLAGLFFLGGVSLRSALPSSTTISIPIATRRPFKAIAFRQSDHIRQKEKPSNLAIDEASILAQAGSLKTENLEPAPPLPWYLQVNTPQHKISPLLERQQLPELPPNPPALLRPILEYISVDLGLDDLSVFDLRKVDPPTPLGANLLAIIGTSRSEKHLHVSADRFCRWLRNAHKLSPYADGLLGRGELKLKLRRKARRAKLLSAVNSSEHGAVDDGLRTGWVCINLGTVEDYNNPAESTVMPEGYVGFGDYANGARVVVQMLTEEKREELDLEGLLQGLLVRHERKQADNSRAVQEFEIGQEVGQISLGTDVQARAISPYDSLNYRVPSTITGQQRSFHSSIGFHVSNVSPKKEADFSRIDPSIAEPRADEPKSSGSRHPNASALNLKFQNTDTEKIKSVLESVEKTHVQPHQGPITLASRKLRALLTYLYELPLEDKLKALGTGFKDFNSTYFLHSFYQTFPIFPDLAHWTKRWALVRHAIEVGHPKYKPEHLMILFDEIRASAVNVPRFLYDDVLGILLSKENRLPSTTFPPFRKFNEALEIIEEMKLRSTDDPKKTHVIDLYFTLATIPTQTPGVDDRPQLRPDALHRLSLVMDELGIDLTDPNIHLQLLETLADNDNWSGFWSHWRGFAKRMQPKPKEFYCLMFERLAQTRHQMNCMDALRTWVPEMEQEIPPVNLSEVATAVLDCLRVAEPTAESDSEKGDNVNSEWVKLWRRCEATF